MTSKNISATWIAEQSRNLNKILPDLVQHKIFYPDAYFYSQYHNDPLQGVHFMANALFKWLEIEPNGCVIDFYDAKELEKNVSADTAGFYTKIKNEKGEDQEVILINSNYKNSPLSVGAILAHEMMHLYLFRLGHKLENVQENELLTDLATIRTGLSILILNGMAYSTEWYLTILFLLFGRIYWKTQQQAFGYFKPKQYGQNALNYFKEQNIAIRDLIGYINPTSRHFVSEWSFSRPTKSTEYIKILEKQHFKSNAIKGGLVALIIMPIIIWNLYADNQKQNLSMLNSQITNCKLSVASLGVRINNDKTALDNINLTLTDYENIGDTESYNSLVPRYNSLVNQAQTEIADYEYQRDSCNKLIDQYNSQLPK